MTFNSSPLSSIHHPIFLTIPSSTSASASVIEILRSIRRNFSSANSFFRSPVYPLRTSTGSSASPIRSTVSIRAATLFSSFFFAPARNFPRAISYKQTAAACPRFIDRCSSRVGIRTSQWQWLKLSFDNPHFSDPNSSATFPFAIPRRSTAPTSKLRKGCWISRFPTAVVPTTIQQSPTASATLPNSSAFCSTAEAPTADTASRNAFAYGRTTRRCIAPKLLIARATAPKFNGFRVPTNTTRKFSISLSVLVPHSLHSYTFTLLYSYTSSR